MSKILLAVYLMHVVWKLSACISESNTVRESLFHLSKMFLKFGRMIKINFFRFDQNAFIAGQMIKSQNTKPLYQNGSLYYFDILTSAALQSRS
jgi:hypothetical protein